MSITDPELRKDIEAQMRTEIHRSCTARDLTESVAQFIVDETIPEWMSSLERAIEMRSSMEEKFIAWCTTDLGLENQTVQQLIRT